MESRRKFIRNTGLIATGALVLPNCSPTKSGGETAVVSNTEPTVLKAKWNMGLQLYTLRNEVSEDLEGTLKYVADLGYDELELYGYRNEEYYGRPAADVYKLIADQGLGIRSAHYLSGRVNAEGQGTLINGWEKAVEDAALAGQTHMVCAYLMEGERETMDQYKELTDILNKAGEVCKKSGIQFCYHNHAFEFETVEDQLPMYYMLDNTDPELVKVELDIFWIVKAGLNAQDFFTKYPGRTELWHVKDLGTRDGEETTVEVGNGSIPFKSIFNDAGKSGLQAFFIEQDHSANPKESVKTSLSRVRELLA